MIENKFVVLSFDEEKNCLSLLWTEETEFLNTEEFISILDMTLEVISQYKPKAILNNLKKFRAIIEDSMQDSILNNYLPDIAGLGVGKIALVYPEDQMAALSIELILQGFDHRIDKSVFNTEDEALQWVCS